MPWTGILTPGDPVQSLVCSQGPEESLGENMMHFFDTVTPPLSDIEQLHF